jgi:hypothetical protein
MKGTVERGSFTERSTAIEDVEHGIAGVERKGIARTHGLLASWGSQ